MLEGEAMRQLLRSFSYRNKLVCFFILLFVTATILQLGVASFIVEDTITAQKQVHFSEALTQMAMRIEMEVSAKEQLIAQIVNNPSIIYYLQDLKKNRDERGIISRIMLEVLRLKPGEFYDVRDLYIYTDDFIPINCYYTEAVEQIDTYSELIMLRLKARYDDTMIWDDAYKEREWFSVYAPIGVSDRLVGLMRVRFEKTFFEDIFRSESIEEATLLTIVDSDGVILYANDPEYIGELANVVDGESNYLFSAPIQKCSWVVMGKIVGSAATGYFKLINTSVILLYGISFLLALGSFSAYAQRTLAPLRQIIAGMKEVEKGNFEARIPVKRSDEFGYIGSGFNAMVDRLQTLLTEVYDYQDTLVQSRQRNLEARLNPHFLYNTLDMIYWSLITSGNMKQGEMILRLSNMLRYSLSTDEDLVPLWKDFLELESYLLLQKCRFGAQLEYSIDLPQVLGDIEVPKLLLQPLVENCFKHAFVGSDRQWQIRIVCLQKGENIELTVEDNGRGMTMDECRRAQERGIGLKLVKDRIAYAYGDTCELKMESIQEEGTRMTVIIARSPLRLLARRRKDKRDAHEDRTC